MFERDCAGLAAVQEALPRVYLSFQLLELLRSIEAVRGHRLHLILKTWGAGPQETLQSERASTQWDARCQPTNLTALDVPSSRIERL